jgi:acyl carrier protein
MPLARLRTLLEEQFPDSEIPADTAALGLGSFPAWDSLGHFGFLMLIEQDFGIRFTVAEISELKHLGEIDRALGAKGIGGP